MFVFSEDLWEKNVYIRHIQSWGEGETCIYTNLRGNTLKN